MFRTGRRDSALLKKLNAVPAGTISRITPDRQFLLENISALLCRCRGNHCGITAPEQRRPAIQSLFFCMARSSHLLRGCVLDARWNSGSGSSRAKPFSIFKMRRMIGVEYSIVVWRTPIGEWKEALYLLTFRREWMPERNCWREIVVRQERCKEC